MVLEGRLVSEIWLTWLEIQSKYRYFLLHYYQASAYWNYRGQKAGRLLSTRCI